MTPSLSAFLSKVIRFAFVGVLGTLLYAGIAFGLEYAGFPVFWAHVIASGISLLASYIGQKTFTFGVYGQHREMGLRFTLATAGLVATQSVLVFGLSWAGVESHIVLLISTLFYPPSSFLVHTFWTFRPRTDGLRD